MSLGLAGLSMGQEKPVVLVFFVHAVGEQWSLWMTWVKYRTPEIMEKK